MSHKPAATNVKGFDIGTSRIVLAQPAEQGYRYETLLNAFIALPYSKMTEAMLRREGILHHVERSEILAYGNRVEEFANILNGDTRRPMSTGFLNPSEPRSLSMMEVAVRSMAGQAQKGERLCFSVPCGLPDQESDIIYHEQTMTQILESLGYEVKSLNEGLAVVYAELESSSFTGIGISFGSGMCNICVAYLGLPVLAFGTARAGDYIDRSAAAVTGKTPTTVRLHKEEFFGLNGFSSNSVDQALSVYYNDMIRGVVAGLRNALTTTKKLPKFEKPLPVAISGGSTRVRRFQPEFEKALLSADLPLEIAEVRLAEDPLNTTARGTLIAAILDM